MNWMSVMVKSLLAACVTAALVTALPAQEKPAGTYQGLVLDRSVDKLVKPVTAKAGNSAFALAVLTDAKAFQVFADAAGLKAGQLGEIDWTRHAVVVVVLKEHTNRLRLKEWSAKDGTGELVFFWDGIEPFYQDRFPALLHKVDRQDLKKVIVKFDHGDGKAITLGAVELTAAGAK
jgi:hypothetical protein